MQFNSISSSFQKVFICFFYLVFFTLVLLFSFSLISSFLLPTTSLECLLHSHYFNCVITQYLKVSLILIFSLFLNFIILMLFPIFCYLCHFFHILYTLIFPLCQALILFCCCYYYIQHPHKQFIKDLIDSDDIYC